MLQWWARLHPLEGVILLLWVPRVLVYGRIGGIEVSSIFHIVYVLALYFRSSVAPLILKYPRLVQ